jgi:hypothetical protein
MSIEKDTRVHTPALAGPTLDDRARVCLCEVLDRVLNKGVVVAGDLTISVADIDLIYLGLELVLTSIDTARQAFRRAPAGQAAGWGIGRDGANGNI